jgi:hypothetical protein
MGPANGVSTTGSSCPRLNLYLIIKAKGFHPWLFVKLKTTPKVEGNYPPMPPVSKKKIRSCPSID